MKHCAIKDPVRQYKKMMSRSGKLKARLTDILKVIPPCISYNMTPISFDIDNGILHGG